MGLTGEERRIARLLVSNGTRDRVARTSRVDIQLEREAGITKHGGPYDPSKFKHEIISNGGTKVGDFVCDRCNRVFQSPSGLGVHRKKIHKINGTSKAAKQAQKRKETAVKPEAEKAPPYVAPAVTTGTTARFKNLHDLLYEIENKEMELLALRIKLRETVEKIET